MRRQPLVLKPRVTYAIFPVLTLGLLVIVQKLVFIATVCYTGNILTVISLKAQLTLVKKRY